MAATYDVTDITQGVAFEPGKAAAPAYIVTFATKPSGIVGTATIPQSSFSTDEVDRVLTAAAMALEQVKAL